MKLLGEPIIEGLIPSHKIAFLNTQKKKIREYGISDPNQTDIALFAQCGIILGTCYELFGQPAPGDNQEEKDKNLYKTTENLYNELSKYFTTYSVEEILEAVKMGYCGHLGELKEFSFPMVSVVNIAKLVQWYNEKIRRPAVEQQGKLQAADTERIEKEKTEEKNKQSRLLVSNNINNVYAYFCEHDDIPTVNGIEISVYELSMWYQFLDERGLCGLDVDQNKSIHLLAEDCVPAFKNLTPAEQFNLKDPVRRKEWDDTRKSLVIEYSRSIALRTVFLKAKSDRKDKIVDINLLNSN